MEQLVIIQNARKKLMENNVSSLIHKHGHFHLQLNNVLVATKVAYHTQNMNAWKPNGSLLKEHKYVHLYPNFSNTSL